MEILYAALLAISAFWLGACPFSLWTGRWFLGRDIRDYGDGNPGAANVFRAGGRKSGVLATILEVAKGVPFVVLAHSFFDFSNGVIMAVALCAILGHAFSPFLRLRGGKAIAVTFGVLLAMPQHEMVIALAVSMCLFALLLENSSWTVMLSTAGSLTYLALTKGNSWEPLLMLCVLTILVAKHFKDLQTIPRFKVRLITWLRTRKRQI